MTLSFACTGTDTCGYQVDMAQGQIHVGNRCDMAQGQIHVGNRCDMA